MNYPDFFDAVEPIEMFDPLAQTLGAIEDGRITYHYIDMVKLAGHSCPTVAGAWLISKIGLQKLYGEALPVRGEILVEVREALEEGTAGVVGSCIGLITGSANEGGFKGLGGRMARHNRLVYGVTMEGDVRLTRLDTNQSVLLRYNPSVVPVHPQQQALMKRMLQGDATSDEKRDFQEMWQNRVKEILLNRDRWSQIVTTH
jgi:formylmethanofuran dehydrogenase subunit E